MKKNLFKFIIAIAIIMSFAGCLPPTNVPAPSEGSETDIDKETVSDIDKKAETDIDEEAGTDDEEIWSDITEENMPSLDGKWVSEVTTSEENKLSNPEGMIYKSEFPSISVNFYNYKEDKKVITKYQPEYEYTLFYYKENGEVFSETDKTFLNNIFPNGSYNDEETLYSVKRSVSEILQTDTKMLYLKKGITFFKIDESRTKILIDGIVYVKSGEADKALSEPEDEGIGNNEDEEDLSNIQWPVKYEVDLNMQGTTTLIFYEDSTVTVELHSETPFGTDFIIIEAITMEGTYEGNPDPSKNHTVNLDILRITDESKINRYLFSQIISDNPIDLTFEASREFLHDATDEEKANLPYQVIIKDGIIDSYN